MLPNGGRSGRPTAPRSLSPTHTVTPLVCPRSPATDLRGTISRSPSTKAACGSAPRKVYSATAGGGLSIFGPPPGFTKRHFCARQQTDLTPIGYYHWSILGNQLIITKVSDRFCADRAELVPGAWTRVGNTTG